MKIAVMQPYLLPYLGYFQLIHAVDKFIVYEDVNFIKQGWINRNNILVNNLPHLFTVPLCNQSSFQKINDIKINEKLYSNWLDKFLKTILQTYGKTPYFKKVYPLICEIFILDKNNIASLSTRSLKLVCNYIGISTQFEEFSSNYNNENLTSEERIVDICLKEKADHYINPIGGLDLYSKEIFLEKEITLNFIKQKDISYKQFNNKFVPNLSIIDMLMFNDIETIKNFLNEYELI